MKILKSKSIYYDDVNLIAQPSDLISRCHIERELHRIIVSPMQAVVGKTFARTAYNLGVSVALHRFSTLEEQINTYKYVAESISENKKNKIWCSIGLNDYSTFENLFDHGARNFIIDIANGYLSSVESMLKCLNYDYKGSETSIMVGNIHTEQGLNLYKNYHNVWVRVGIGQGCFTPESKILTSNGYKRIDEIKKGDLVLTHKNKFEPVQEIYQYYKNEDLIEINDIKCTKNHEFYVINKKYQHLVNELNYHDYAEWIAAENLNEDFFLIEL